MRDLPHSRAPGVEVVGRKLSVLVRIPRDLENRELNQIEKIFLDLAIGLEVLHVARTYRRQRRLLDAEIAQLRLKLYQFREVRNELRLAGIPELNRGEDQSARDGEGRERLKSDLDDLKCWRHA